MINITKKFQKVTTLYSQSNLRDAEIICRQILGFEPENPDANHFLGIIAIGAGNLVVAKEYIK